MQQAPPRASDLLPSNFDDLLKAAVECFWRTKDKKANASQWGTRSSVLSGKHLDGFLATFEQVARHVGLPPTSIITKGRLLNLPGYFRVTKNWDALVLHQGRLLALLELKSQVGSFGNNQNNRIEEVVGLGHDFWTARREGLGQRGGASAQDPRPPFLSYLFLLEDRPESTEEVVGLKSGSFQMDPAFRRATYAERYRIMAERLMSERLYEAVSLVLSESQSGREAGHYRVLSEATDPRALFSALAGHLLAAIA